MRDGFKHLEAALGQLRIQELGQAGAEGRVLVHDHHGLCGLAGLIVQHDQIVERSLGNDAKARAEAKRVFQPAGDDRVDDADIDDIGQVVARSGLARGEADAAGVAADDRRNTGGIHLLDLRVAALRRRLRVAEKGLDLGAAERLDAAGGVDFLDRELRADAALLARVGQGTGNWVQHADLDGGALRTQHGWSAEQAGGRGGAQRGGLQEPAAADSRKWMRHARPP